MTVLRYYEGNENTVNNGKSAHNEHFFLMYNPIKILTTMTKYQFLLKKKKAES